MTTGKISLEKTAFKYGSYISLGLIGYFLLMKLLGLIHVIELRFFNAVIIAIGISLAISNYKKGKEGMINYLEGLGLGFITSGIASILFGIFMVIYLTVFDPAFLDTLTQLEPLAGRLTIMPIVVIFGVIILEGLISGFMIAFIAMQYFKRPDHVEKGWNQMKEEKQV